MVLQLQLPYFREPKELPAPLPSIDEIHASPNVLNGVEAWATRKVVRVGEHFVVKYGPCNVQLEGENLLFIKQNLRIPAPRLYAMWIEPDGTFYLVMEYLQGDTLQSLWPNLKGSEKDLILSKSKVVFNQIRAFPSPGFFGDVNRSHLPHRLFYTPDYDQKISGPFESERDMVLGLISKLRLKAEGTERRSYLADSLEDQILGDLVNDDRRPTFTHSDLRRKNILVRQISAPDMAQEKDYEVSIVGWGSAGWYPQYWEYASSFFELKLDDDWPVKIAGIVDAWPAEAAAMRMINHDMRWVSTHD